MSRTQEAAHIVTHPDFVEVAHVHPLLHKWVLDFLVMPDPMPPSYNRWEDYERLRAYVKSIVGWYAGDARFGDTKYYEACMKIEWLIPWPAHGSQKRVSSIEFTGS